VSRSGGRRAIALTGRRTIRPGRRRAITLSLLTLAMTATVVVRRRRSTTASTGRAPQAFGASDGPGTSGQAQPAATRATPWTSLVSGRSQRTMEMARLGSRVGATYATGSARQIFASAERRQELRAERQLQTTAEVVETLGSMKGVFMKLGQMASYLDAGLDPQIRQSLATLQSNAPPMAAALAAEVITEQLGAPPEEIFAEWDPVPLAAASIGQVHRAITRDGYAVAVKVQYPGVDEAIRSDLDNSAVLLQVIRMAFPSLDAAGLLAELRSRIGEELDYRLEAANQAAFAEMFADHPFIHVPRVFPELSRERVLTSELVVGARYEEVLDWPEEERNLAGESIFRFVFGCLYRGRVFNGDPHPGNYLFHPGGRVTFLDFGLVKWFTDRDVTQLATMVRSLVTEKDNAAFRRAVEEAGFLKPDAELSDDQVADYFRHYYELVLRQGPTTVSADFATDTVRRFFDATDPVVRRANVPASFVILQRINLGLYAVLAGLGATGDWARICQEIYPWVAAPPSTALGRAEADWRNDQSRSSVSRSTGPTTPGDRASTPEHRPAPVGAALPTGRPSRSRRA
jgi:predicted unusual protein kinase regulating ubiquinone biosynthesis (AarF/ABC1/UbiB family)